MNSKSLQNNWKNFHFRLVDLSDIPKILEHLTNNFHKDEPIHSFALPDDKYPEFSNARIAKQMENDEVRALSFIAVDTISGEIAGVQLQFKWTKQDAIHPPQYDSLPKDNKTSDPPPPFRKVLDLTFAPLQQSKLGMFEKYKVDYVIWNFMMSVDRKFRYQGLGSEMYRRMIELLKEKKCPLVFSVFSSPFSRRCAEKVGFVEIDKVMYDSVADENGTLMLPKATSNDYANLMILQL